jgi:hypothetical protein
VRRDGIRRLLLVETGYHAYYQVQPLGVEIVCVWKANRREPKL